MVGKVFVDERALGTEINSGSLQAFPKRVVILQPSYLPWLGYFEQMARADQFVFLDDVQFTRRDWRNRNRVRTKDGWSWLTIPVIQKGQFDQSLRETRVDNGINWRRKHCETIRLNYARAPFFDRYFPGLESLYNREWVFLLDVCRESTFFIRDQLGIRTPVCNASDFRLQKSGGDRVRELCEGLGATHYLSGDAGKNYLSVDEFAAKGIVLEFQGYRHPEYRQRFPEFVPYLSAIDLLFNCGEDSLAILMGNQDKTSGSAPSS